MLTEHAKVPGNECDVDPGMTIPECSNVSRKKELFVDVPHDNTSLSNAGFMLLTQ